MFGVFTLYYAFIIMSQFIEFCLIFFFKCKYKCIVFSLNSNNQWNEINLKF